MLAQGYEPSQACGPTHTRPTDVQVITRGLRLDNVKVPAIISKDIKYELGLPLVQMSSNSSLSVFSSELLYAILKLYNLLSAAPRFV